MEMTSIHYMLVRREETLLLFYSDVADAELHRFIIGDANSDLVMDFHTEVWHTTVSSTIVMEKTKCLVSPHQDLRFGGHIGLLHLL
jgi:hypothetical protein